MKVWILQEGRWIAGIIGIVIGWTVGIILTGCFRPEEKKWIDTYQEDYWTGHLAKANLVPSKYKTSESMTQGYKGEPR